MSRKFGPEGLQERREKYGALIAAHRGHFGGNIIQNTVTSCELALMEGADIVEVDVTCSKDGTFYLFHTGAEKTVFQQKIDLTQMKAAEIDKLVCLNAIGERSGVHVQKFGDFLQAMKGKCYINVDRAWKEDWTGAVQMIIDAGMEDQVILKCPVNETYMTQLEQLHTKVMFMPILYKPEEWDAVRKHRKLNVVAAELVYLHDGDPVADPKFIARLHKQGRLAWVNTLKLFDYASICGDRDDDIAIKGDPDGSWGALLDRGFDVLQTDWPELVRPYVKQYMRKKKV